ncbi:hypothetical protein TNCV_2433731 [Trichonephila clavipes]|nr:hypothetical protein TNCV_2433731 [Trichonephila clavipes]
MLPGSSTSLTALFHGCGSHLKLQECVVDGTGEVVLEVRRPQKTYISSYQQKGTGAPQLSRWQISFLLPQESRSPEKLLPDVCGEEDYTHADLLCVSHSPDSTVLPVCNGVVSITIGLNRTGHAYYSQMRVGSVRHRIVDAN